MEQRWRTSGEMTPCELISQCMTMVAMRMFWTECMKSESRYRYFFEGIEVCTRRIYAGGCHGCQEIHSIRLRIARNRCRDFTVCLFATLNLEYCRYQSVSPT